MKNLSYKIKFLAVLILLLPVYSCEKYLDNELHNATYVDNFWKTQADAESAISGAYAFLRNKLQEGSSFFFWGESPAGFMKLDGWNISPISESGNFSAWYKENQLHDWTKFYQTIAVCNQVIDKVPGIDNSSFKGADPVGDKQRLIGEGYFLRALCYFYMVRIWGDVPLELKPIYQSEQIVVKAREKESIVIDTLIRDAKKAAGYLTWQNMDDFARVRANRGAAWALLAHAYAWRHDYENAEKYCDSVINHNDEHLELEQNANIRNMFKTSTSKENIFVLSFMNNESYTSDIAFDMLMDPYIKGRTETPKLRPLPEKILQYYFNGDTTDFLKDIRLQYFFGLWTPPGPILIKYSDIWYKTENDPHCESNIIVFRLADIILLHAEALANLQRESEAFNELNKIRDRAQISKKTSSVNLIQEILYERFRELVGEGQNYYDQIRMGYYPDWLTGDRAKPEMKGWLWPIHKKMFKNNRLMTQNEWWKGRY